MSIYDIIYLRKLGTYMRVKTPVLSEEYDCASIWTRPLPAAGRIPEKTRTRSARTMTTAHARNYMFVRSSVHYNVMVLYVHIYMYMYILLYMPNMYIIRIPDLCRPSRSIAYG